MKNYIDGGFYGWTQTGIAGILGLSLILHYLGLL